MAVTLLLLTPAAARAAAPTQQTLFPEEETLLTIQTTPKAVCILGHATEKGLHLQFDADDRGVVRIHVAARTGAQPIAVRLDCKGEDGHATSYPIELRTGTFGTLPNALPKEQERLGVPASKEKLRPPLQGNELELSRKDLLSRGYPPRPDPTTAPSLYARWLRIVSRPLTIVDPRTVPHPELSFGQNSPLDSQRLDSPTLPFGPLSALSQVFFNSASKNWSGAVISAPGGQLFLAAADWSVPGVSPVGAPPNAVAGEWVGLDGYVPGSADIQQSGSASNSYNISGYAFTNYYMWIESWPSPPASVPNFAVSAGDEVWVFVSLADQNGQTWFSDGSFGNLTAADNTVWFLLINGTQNESAIIKIPTPSAFVGTSAEFIMERPQVFGSYSPLANFGEASMLGVSYMDSYYGERPWPLACYGHTSFADKLAFINMKNGADLLDVTLPTAVGDPVGACNILWIWTDWS
jgi:hypothetical protein